MPSFNFFKRKDKDISKLNNKKSAAAGGGGGGGGGGGQIQQHLRFKPQTIKLLLRMR